ncbi:MFS transporter [Actinocrispum wychmicini]|uniref:Putative MFS family arabinose efflux permease n=1 Tax=Actinocrispum wychmicini TaxID=1213861 RepID=A0A4R2IX41_9PSEU|nr:MFS transporter [Actinocrispum wychmicini]TCO48818.1 putative MFS family arabinose efflux permease [Actinocrispum wychmicini]
MNVTLSRPFARLWVAGLFAEVAEWMLQVALPVFIYQATGSASATALTMAVGVLPMVLLSPVAGMVADRWDRGRVLWCVCLAQAGVVVPLLAGARAMLVVYVVMAAQAGLATLFEPARNSLMPSLVPADKITAANGLMGINSSVSRLAGSSLGGLVLGIGGLGWVLTAYVAALVFAAVLLLPRFADTSARGTAPMSGWLAGFTAFRRDLQLRSALVTLVLCAFAQGMFLVLFVVFVTGPLRGGDTEVGLLRGIQAIGGLAAGGVIATVARRVAPSTLFGGGALVLGALSIVVWNFPSVTTDTAIYVALFAVVGAPAVFYVSGMLTVLQTATAPDRAGRVLATAFAVIAGCQAAGSLTAGALIDVWNLNVLLNAQAGILVAAGLVALARHSPRLLPHNHVTAYGSNG